jgi:hypothetical protein
MAKTRGEKRLGSITYSKLAAWTTLSLHTIRYHGAKGTFKGMGVDELIQWANEYRKAAGLPMIGQPGEPANTVLEPIKSPNVTLGAAGDLQEWQPLPIAPPASGGYNPLTGEYDNG